MSPSICRKYRDSFAFASRCRKIKNCKRCNGKIRVPIGMWPCRVEKKMTLKEVDGKTIEEIKTKIIAKDGTITKVPGKFQGSPINEFVPHRLPQLESNMNGWLVEDEEELERNKVDSDLESTASSKPKRVELEDTCESGKMDQNLRSGPNNNNNNNNKNPNIATIIAQQLQTILPQIVTQVTNNVNNANGGNGRNNGCTYKGFMACNPKEYDGKRGAIALTRWIEKMENVIENSGCAKNQKALLVEEFCPRNEIEKLESEFWNYKMVGANHGGYTDRFHELAKLVPHLVTPESSRIKRYMAGLAPEIQEMLRATPTTIQSAILRAGILTNEAVSYGTLTKGNDKRKVVEEYSKSGGSWKDNKKAKDCRVPIRQATLVSAIRMSNNSRVSYEYGSPDHFRNNCPKMYQGPSQPSNQRALEGNRNTRSSGNQIRGRAFNANVGCTYKGFMACNPKEYDGKRGAIALTRWIEKMENVIDNSGCAENQKALLVEELCPSNIEKLESEFWNHKMVGANHAGYTDRFHELAKLVSHLVTPESSRIKRAGILTDEAVSYGTLTKGNDKRKVVDESSKSGGSWKDNKKAKDHNVVTGTFSLNDHIVTLLFDSGADFSFISTKFAPLLNVKTSIVNHGYVIEVADGKKVEVDRIIRNCKLELGSSRFSINLIPLGTDISKITRKLDKNKHENG
nr:reverse transcriptase domain-containing protein [Tanacetum cinerariifolium]